MARVVGRAMVKHFLGGFGLLAGASYPFRAFTYLRRYPKLRSYLIIPICLNVVLGIGLYFGLLLWGWSASQDWITQGVARVDAAIAALPPWLEFLEWIPLGLAWSVRVLAGIGLLLITGFVFAQFGVLLGSPWYGQLSEQLEKIETGQIEFVEVGFLSDLGRAISFEIEKLALLIAIGLPLLIVQFIPGLGTGISMVGGISLTALLAGLDFLDAPLERRRLKFRNKLGWVVRNLPASASFSGMCLFLVSIPLLNLITIPLCVAGGTLFFCDRIYPQLTQTARSPAPTQF